MARGTTLNELVTMVREEAGHSTNASLGQNTYEALKQKLRRQQELLWEDYEWPHLRVEREITLAAGQRYYDFPVDLSKNHRIDQVSVYYQEEWRPVLHEITLADYNMVDPDKNERQDPPIRWELYEGEQVEIWPVPETNGTRVRMRGTRNLKPLLADSDKADLDDRLLVLFVAAELAAKQKQEDASQKLKLAQRLYEKLKGNNSKDRTFRVGARNRHDCPDYRPRPLYGKRL